MSDELRRLEQQLRTAFAGQAWHGPAVLELLAGVTPEQAYARPVPGAHTIWELVLHLGGAYRLVLRRLGGDERPLSPDEDWPPVPAVSADTWRNTIGTLEKLSEETRRAVADFPPERLDQPLVSTSPYTAYAQFIGLTQHDLYHAGQIALLKRAITHLPLATTGNMGPRRLEIFFYGLFMDPQVLEAKGIQPIDVRLAALPGFTLRIGARAALVPASGGEVHGVLMKLSHAELEKLYSDPGVQAYRAEPVLAVASDGASVAALCYNLPEPPPADEHNVEYAAKLRSLAQRIGLPAEYITSIR